MAQLEAHVLPESGDRKQDIGRYAPTAPEAISSRDDNNYVTHLNEMSRMSVTCKLRQCRFNMQNVRPSNLRFARKVVHQYSLICIVNINYFPVTCLTNQSLRSGIFPDNLKITKVFPLFRLSNTNDNNRITNYRPISFLASLSKIFEKVVSIQ